MLPDLQVRYVSATSIGLFEQSNPHYGEIWYTFGTGNAARRTVSRATTAEAVLETIYELAGITPPAEDPNDVFRGHPLATTARGAAATFYLAWPALVALSYFLYRRGR